MRLMKNSILIYALLISIILISCSSYTISKDSLINQLEKNQNVYNDSNLRSLGTNYFSNHLDKIKCVDGKNQNVYLHSGKNVNFKISKLSDSRTINMYFDTVYIQNDTLFGLKSRIIGGKRKVALKDINNIIISAEEAVIEVIK